VVGGQGHAPAALPLGKRIGPTAGVDRCYIDYAVPVHPLHDVEKQYTVFWYFIDLWAIGLHKYSQLLS